MAEHQRCEATDKMRPLPKIISYNALGFLTTVSVIFISLTACDAFQQVRTFASTTQPSLVLLSLSDQAKGNHNAYSEKEGYSRYIVSNRRKNKVLRMRDRMLKDLRRARDGEDSNFEAVLDDTLPFLKWGLRRKSTEPGTLVLIRSGESEWNVESRFIGWAGDPDLTDRGRREMEHAARLLIEGGYEIDVVFTSRLRRAVQSVWTLLRELGQQYLPVFKSWRSVLSCFSCLPD